jgi:hypothetical protein
MTVFTRSSNNPGGYTRKPAADLYTVLLIFALLALLLGFLYLHLEMKAYDYKMNADVSIVMAVERGGSAIAGFSLPAEIEYRHTTDESCFA